MSWSDFRIIHSLKPDPLSIHLKLGKMLSALLSDDGVGAAQACVNLVYSGSGFSAWMGWLRACQGQPLPDLSDCGI